MVESNFTVKQILGGEHAFYSQENYEEATRREMSSAGPLKKPVYIYNTENRIWRIVKDIFSLIIFPIGLYRLVHSLVGMCVVPASVGVDERQLPQCLEVTPNDWLMEGGGSKFCCSSRYAQRQRRMNTPSAMIAGWKVKRIAVEVDGYTIDAVIMGKENTLTNGRWVLTSLGNGEFYEDQFSSSSRDFRQILSHINGNAIVFNYPGVGASTGMPNRYAMAKAYRAMLNFLEDQEKGIGAKEIIGYGHSIGGGVQGDALCSHELKQDVKYVFVKSRTFSDLSTIASHLYNRLLGFLVKIFGWNMGSVESSKKLQAPEIIIQTISGGLGYIDFSKQPQLIKHDGVIPAESSLAKALLKDKPQGWQNKYFMGVAAEQHNTPLRGTVLLCDKIKEMLEQNEG